MHFRNLSARLAIGLVALLLALPACAAEQAAGGAPALETEDQKTIYAIGVMVSRQLAQLALSEEELAIVLRGIADGASGGETAVDLNDYSGKIQGFAQARAATAAEAEAEAAAAFVEEQAAEEGAVKTDSGIVLFELTPGTGASPGATDRVTVHYHGTLRDGTVFDSSVDRGQPATFPLNGVIPCWTEAVQQMKVGSKSRIVCPPALAYGPQGRPGIPGNAALVFEIELLSIEDQEGAGDAAGAGDASG